VCAETESTMEVKRAQGGHVYLLSKEKQSFLEAILFCKNFPGFRLAELTSSIQAESLQMLDEYFGKMM